MALTLAWLVVALVGGGTGRAQPLSSEPVGDGFDAPMYATHAPGLSGLLFVAERAGIIRAVDLATGATLRRRSSTSRHSSSHRSRAGFSGSRFRNDYGTEHRREDA